MKDKKTTNTTEKINGKRGGKLSSRQRDSLTMVNKGLESNENS